MPPIITLTTDFGEGSPYVAQMKGVILSIAKSAVIVDISHTIQPQDVRQGAVVLDDVAMRFPPGTIHVAVVDPGVGTQRRIVHLKSSDQLFIAPDNGLLSLIAGRFPPEIIIELTNSKYWSEEISATFHGRDIMAPVAAHLAKGVSSSALGPPIKELVELNWPPVKMQAREIVGSVLFIDNFGNVITNITSEMIQRTFGSAEAISVACAGASTDKFVRTYGSSAGGTLIALLGSSGRLELAVVAGSAARQLKAEVGMPVVVR